jgi:hypothetical protein
MSDNLLALVLERDKEIAALKAERDRLREALIVARDAVVVSMDGCVPNKSWGTAILTQIDAALAKEV